MVQSLLSSIFLSSHGRSGGLASHDNDNEKSVWFLRIVILEVETVTVFPPVVERPSLKHESTQLP